MGKPKSKGRSNNGAVVGTAQEGGGATCGSVPAAHHVNPVGDVSSALGSKEDVASSGENGADDKNRSSVACRYFQRGYCWNGDSCRFRHLEEEAGPKDTPSFYQQPSGSPFNPNTSKVTPPAPSYAIPKARPKQPPRAPEECLDFYRNGSCPRYRTCRYAHPPHLKRAGLSGSAKASGLGVFGDVSLLNSLNRFGGGFFDDDDGDLMEDRIANGGFTEDDIYELSLQGIKPWDPEAAAALAVLKGWDMDFDGSYGYDHFDDELGRKMSGFGLY